ncbi:concanavalin A-like lectin/glucanase domain-containing protein [Limtongia smithiae]|uniref:concanavalin A-like lectin/glucanase domain-containing protein n=1 Tax=Limtongia smithiae TaxID=1125753 RepID=UPI0034CD3E10
MVFSLRSALAGAFASSLLLAGSAVATCDPLETTCDGDPALGGSVSIDFTAGESAYFNATYDSDLITYNSTYGLTMTINEDGDAPTVASDFYMFFGKMEFVAQAAPGVGIVSSVVLVSDDGDEIDVEWVGGDDYHVQTNYFSKANTTTYDRGGMTDVDDPVGSFHTYMVDWTETMTTWYVDGVSVRELYANNSEGYPQTPMQIKIGAWVAGSSSSAEGTIEWAGGLADFTDAPFIFYVKSLSATDYSTGTEYVYTDTSGDASSIEIVNEGTAGIASDSTASASSSSATSTAISSSSTSSARSTTSSSKKTTATSSSATTSTSSSTKSSSSMAASSSAPSSAAATSSEGHNRGISSSFGASSAVASATVESTTAVSSVVMSSSAAATTSVATYVGGSGSNSTTLATSTTSSGLNSTSSTANSTAVSTTASASSSVETTSSGAAGLQPMAWIGTVVVIACGFAVLS